MYLMFRIHSECSQENPPIVNRENTYDLESISFYYNNLSLKVTVILNRFCTFIPSSYQYKKSYDFIMDCSCNLIIN